MPDRTLRALAACALATLLLATAGHGGEPRFEPPAWIEDPDEARAVAALFENAAEATALHRELVRWFRSGGREGLHPADHRPRLDALRAALAEGAPPPRLAALTQLVSEALRLQGEFFVDWQRAVEAGRPFESQMDSEFGHHVGLHHAHRHLVRAYAELRGLFPQVGAEAFRELHDRLRGLDLH